MESLRPESRLEERMIAKAAAAGIPLSGSLELLPLCNMNCDMCYVHMTTEEQRALQPLRSVDEWISLAEELKTAGTVFLLLTGGEPLLYPGFRELYLKLQELGFILTINTNGTLLDESFADFFAAHRPRRINITLYGISEETYSQLCHYGPGYEKAVQAIRLLRERGVDVKVNGSLVRLNKNQADQITAAAKELDAAVHIDTYMYPAVRERTVPYDRQSRLTPEEASEASLKLYQEEHSAEDFQKYAEDICETVAHTKQGKPEEECMRCQAACSSFTVSWQGLLRPCVMLTNPSIPVMETGFAAGWEKLREWRAGVRLCPDCAECRYRLVCSRCAASCLHESGSLQGKPEYLCRLTEHYVNILQKLLSGNAAEEPDFRSK